MSVSIYTVTHVPFTPPKNPIYIPLQVGAALHEHYGYLCDDTGDNISDKNPYYSELTGLYWIWKNAADTDYIGLCHYRRYFLNQNGNLMTEEDYVNILSNYDVIVSQSQAGEYDYRTVYGRSHDSRNLDLVCEIIQKLYPEYLDTFQEVLSDHRCYTGNLFVAPKELFCAYSKWLFDIFFAMEPLIQTENYDEYHRRLFGFLSEQLLIVWVKHNRLSYYEAPFELCQEKAETISLKAELARYVQNNDLDGAYKHLCETLEKRPDLLLAMSDFNQDLKVIEHIFNICRIETENELPTMFALSHDLDILNKHFRLLISILEHIQNQTVKKEELQYLLDYKVSSCALIYILQNFKQFSAQPLILLNQLALVYSASEPLTALSLLEAALTISESDSTTLSNIVSVFRSMGQEELAAEYEELLNRAISNTETPPAPSKRIAFFIGSEYAILDYISEQYIQAFRKLGHTVFCFDKNNFEQSFQQLISFKEQGLDLVILLNNSCFQMKLQSNQSLWDYWKVPCCNIIVDHPMYYFDTLDGAPETGVVVCSDRYHTEYITRFYKTVRQTFFLPTAGSCLHPYEELKPYANRSIDVLFIGSYKFNDNTSHDTFDERLCELAMQRPDLRFEQLVTLCLQDTGKNPTEEELKLIIQQHRFTDTNILSLYRTRVIELLVENDIHVTVYGNGWDKLNIFHHPCFHYQGLINPEDGIALMEDSKIVLNQLAWFKAGASERIFEAMLQGAISLTDTSEYLLEEFTDNVDIAFYSLKQLDKLPNIVHTLLNDLNLAETIRKNAYQKAVQNHTWTERAKTLLSHVLL